MRFSGQQTGLHLTVRGGVGETTICNLHLLNYMNKLIILVLICQIFTFKLCFLSECEFWYSGVIHEPPPSAAASVVWFDKLIRPILNKSSTSESKGNFVFAILPELEKKIQLIRALFVSPEIVESNPQGVKETFVRLYCQVLGILFDNGHLDNFEESASKLGGLGGYFMFKSAETLTRARLIEHLQKFESLLGVKIKIAMINAGSTRLSPVLSKLFNETGLLQLYRHPFNVVGSEIYYGKSGFDSKESFELVKASEWTVESSRPCYQINQTYPIRLTNSADCADAVSEEDREITERLEKLYGPLEEIPLDTESPVDELTLTDEFIVSDKNFPVDFDEISSEEFEDFEYEFISQRDLI